MPLHSPINPMAIIKAVAAPLIAPIRQELKLRNADEKRAVFAGVDAEMTAALDVLAGDAEAPGKALLDFLKGKIADRPGYFSEQPTSTWIRTSKTQSLVKQAVEAEMAGGDVQALADEAAAFFAEFPEAEGPGHGYVAFEYAVAFVALSITRHLTVGDRMLKRAIDGLSDQVVAATAAVPVALLDAHVAELLEHIRRSRFFDGSDFRAEAERLAVRLQGRGDLERASDAARAEGIALCARYLARTAEPVRVSELIAIARALGATEPATALGEAILLSRDDWQAGLARLAPIDTPVKRTLALQIVLTDQGPDGALAWAAAAGIDDGDLDSDGRNVLLSVRMQAEAWDAAHAQALRLTAADYAGTPAIQQVAALARIVHHVADDLKAIAATGTPLDADGFPLFDTPEALNERRIAIALLNDAAVAAQSFGCVRAARTFANVALWLELRDPASAVQARDRLEGLLGAGDPISWVPLGLSFGVPLDMNAVERALDRAEALNPAGDPEAAFARLAIAATTADPIVAADYFAKHRRLIIEQLSRSGVVDFEVQLLTRADRREEAEQRLEEVRAELAPGLYARLEAIVRQGAKGPSVADLEAAYEAEPSTVTLAHLVVALSRQGWSERVFELARTLIASTQALSDIESLVNFLSRHERHTEIATVLDEQAGLVPQSPALRTALAWSLYRRGDLDRAAEVLKGLRAQRDHADDRTLHIAILVTAGRWPELAAHVEAEWQRRDDRSAAELLHLAQFAVQIGSPRVAALIALAAEKAPADPEILAGCYMMSTQAGLEASAAVHQWIATAADLSGEDGPVQTADIETVIAQAPAWDAQVADTWAKLKSGEIPLLAAARLLRRPALELQLVPMLANADEPDPRRRSVVPAYSGAHVGGAPAAGTLALAGSSLITLAALDLIDSVVARAPIRIAHGTLRWLFAERQRLAFHQPSRIAFAHAISRAINSKRLWPFIASAPVDEKLVDQIGRALTAMLTSAAASPAGTPSCRVVRSSPVHKLGSFRGEGVDLLRFHAQLCSCQAVIDKLVEAGQLTQSEEDRARVYLEQNEERWPGEPPIEDGAHLYLDDLSVSFLNTVGVLDKLHAAGLRAHISEHELDETQALIDLENRSEAIEAVIERLRASLAEGIASGRVLLNQLRNEDELHEHPDVAMLDGVGIVDAIVYDDRFLNRVAHMDAPGGRSLIWTSLDVLATLHEEGTLSTEDLGRHRTALRQAGLILVPASTEELINFLARVRLRDGEMVETAELRAIRENLLMAQMRGWLALPAESEWLQTVTGNLINALVAQWTESISDEDARARSRWLFSLADMRGWAGMVTINDGSGMAIFGLGIAVHNLLLRRSEVDPAVLQRFDAWLDEEVLAPFKDEDPLRYAWLVERVREIAWEGQEQGYDG